VIGRARPRTRVTALSVAAFVLAGCGIEPRDSITVPASPQADEIAWLWWLSLWLGVAVWLIVMVLLAVPLLRSRRRAPSRTSPARRIGGGQCQPESRGVFDLGRVRRP
jgi:heme/copper-type cytochrome/quinol oxidase subunit 2